jgi:chemotaxis protein CheD
MTKGKTHLQREPGGGARVPRPALPGFEHINRYWDASNSQYAAKILPGEFYVTHHEEEMIVTVLGSCVSACIRDPIFGIGGMNHFMLPGDSRQASQSWGDGAEASTRYGIHAMERLINDILKNGGSRRNLEVKVTGGGRILAQMADIGARNIRFIQEFVQAEGLRLLAEDVGDIYPRKVYYFPTTGKLRVKKLRTLHNRTILERETSYQRELTRQPVEGEVELF